MSLVKYEQATSATHVYSEFTLAEEEHTTP